MIPIKEERVLVRPKDITPSNKKLEVVGTLNPGAARLKDGRIILYVRVIEKLKKDENEKYYFSPRCSGKKSCRIIIDRFKKEKAESKSDVDIVFKDGTKRLTFISHLRRVILDLSGLKVISIDKKPSFSGIEEEGELGVEDARIVKFGSRYYMSYVSLSRLGNISTSLAVSYDCMNWKRKGTMFREQNKDVVLFPEKIRGKYVAFNRPEGNFQFTPPKIWISLSNNLKLWGESRPIKLSKKGSWDYARTGAGPPPIKTDKGWLLIYHGVRTKEVKSKTNIIKKILHEQEKEFSSVYSVGAALFDLKKPYKLIAKTHKPILTPQKKYEKEGFVENVIFPTGIVFTRGHNNILLYSGAGDTLTTVKKIALKDILRSLEKVNY